MNTLQLSHADAAPWGAPLLTDITLALAAGQILALVGPNGAGKSSLLHLIAGDIPLSSGELLLGGKQRREWPRRELARRLAYLPQLSLLNFPYTVEEVVSLGRMPPASGMAHDRDILSQVMAATDTGGLRHRLYPQLSGGEKQRVQLARVFAQIWSANTGGLLLLDEPTTALDLSHQQLIMAAVRELTATGCSVVLAIHDLNLAAECADTIAVIHNGRVAALGAPADVFNAQMFREIFTIDVLVQQHPDRAHPLVISR